MNTILNDTYEHNDDHVVVPMNLIKTTLGISEDYAGVEFDKNTNALILTTENKGEAYA